MGGFILNKAQTGGFSRPIKPLDIMWYHVKDLRQKHICGDGILYIKPSQADFNLSNVIQEEVSVLFIFNICMFLT